MVHFYATIAHNDPSFLNQLKALTPDPRGAYILKAILDEAENYPSLTLIPFKGFESAVDMDCLWYEFFATGSEEPVKKIIDILNFPATKDMDLVITTQGAAIFSLKANEKHDKKVFEIIKNQAASASGELKNKLENILDYMK